MNNNVQRLISGTLALALLVGIVPPAFATLEGDTIHVIIKDAGGTVINEFDIVDIPGGPSGDGQIWFFGNPIFAGMTISSQGQISLNYNNQGEDPFSFEAHTIWIEDIDWTDSPGRIIDVVPQLEEIAATVSFTDDSVHIMVEAFSLLPDDPPSTSTQNLYLIIAEHPEPPVVGGEFLPIDTTSLLLAGTQSTTWLIPVVLSIVGIGLVLVRRK